MTGHPADPRSLTRRVVADHAAVAERRSHRALESTLQRTASIAGREVLAHLATSGELSASELSSVLHGQSPTAEKTVSWVPKWAGSLAWTMAAQDTQPSDREEALLILDALRETHGPAVLGSGLLQRLRLDLLTLHARWDDLEQALHDNPLGERDLARYWADATNPHLRKGASDHRVWLDHLNRVIPSEMGSVAVVPDAVTPFDGLWCPTLVKNPPSRGTVTVVVSVHDPGIELRSSIESILRQSYRDLEVIVVDDCSTVDAYGLLDSLPHLDPRIRVVRLGANGGTYRCRNYAISLARGRYITFQDDDDWSHPDRIAHQVAHLAANEQVMACTIACIRATAALGLVKLGYREVTRNTSSLMFRRVAVTSRIGFYDSVRKSADTEYIRRMMTVFGSDSVAELPLTLSMVRVGLDSLSHGEFKPGWRHRSRWVYGMLYQRWHEAIGEGRSTPMIDTIINHSRPFPAPRNLDRRTDRANHYDVVLIGDWRALGGPQRSMLAEIETLLAAGRRVGVSHLEALRFMVAGERPLCDPILEMIENGQVDYVLLDDQIDVDLLVLRYPPLLQFPPCDPSSWIVGRMLIVANQAPYEHDGSDARYDPDRCTVMAERLFGVTPTWVPQGPTVREVLERLVSADLLAEEDMPGVLDVADWPSPTDLDLVPPRPDQCVIGRVSRDSPNKFPVDPQELIEAYTVPQASVRMLGAVKTVPALLGAAVAEDWELLPVNSVPVQDFLAGIDVFVYFDNPTVREAFGRVVLEAIAANCLVILPERFRSTFGEAAIYCTADQVSDVVTLHLTDQRLWRDQLLRARRVFEERFSRQAQLRRFETLGTSVSVG